MDVVTITFVFNKYREKIVYLLMVVTRMINCHGSRKKFLKMGLVFQMNL